MLKTFEFANFDGMSSAAAELIAKEIMAAKKQFSIAFPGGNSVKGILENLSSRPIGWQGVNVFMADERLVPPTDPQSNFAQANELFFSKVPGIHAFPFDPEKGIDDYNKKFLIVTKGNFDMVVLGVGEDGHIASLFPHNPALKSAEDGYIPVHGAPKPPPQRITLSHEAITKAGIVILLFASDSKLEAYEKFCDPETEEADCPAKIALKARRTFVFTVFGGANLAEGI